MKQFLPILILSAGLLGCSTNSTKQVETAGDLSNRHPAAFTSNGSIVCSNENFYFSAMETGATAEGQPPLRNIVVVYEGKVIDHEEGVKLAVNAKIGLVRSDVVSLKKEETSKKGQSYEISMNTISWKLGKIERLSEQAVCEIRY